MNVGYLKGRFKHAQAMDADVVKIDIEEFASLLKWIDEEQKRITDAVERGYKSGRLGAYDEVIRELETKMREERDDERRVD